jgi:hypothetical protein
MKNSLKNLLIVATLGIVSAQAQSDCPKVVQQVNAAVAADKSEVLNVVASEAEKSPDCVCEIVKAAIVASKASKSTVGAIVEAAGNAAPDRLDLIVQCATATAPDASGNINTAAAKVQGNNPSGGPANPLEFPGEGGIGPAPGTDGGSSILRPGFQFDSPPIIDSPVITNPNQL